MISKETNAAYVIIFSLTFIAAYIGKISYWALFYVAIAYLSLYQYVYEASKIRKEIKKLKNKL